MNEKLKNSIKLALKDTFNKWLKEKQLGVPTATEFAEDLMANGMT